MKLKYSYTYTTLLFLIAVLLSCNKQNDWLDIKPNKSDVVPSKIEDYQAIIDYDQVLNYSYPSIGMVGADNYFLAYSSWQAAASATERNAYTWTPDIYEGATSPDWNNSYKMVLYANVVLEGIQKIPVTSQNLLAWNNCRGSALFFRASAFHNLAQLFAKPYSAASANTDLGIPLKLSADVNMLSARSTLQETYTQIITDLKEAESILPPIASSQNRPSKCAAEALLARVYQSMDDYTNAAAYATSALSIYNSLIDFNTLSTTASKPLPAFPNNKEVIFYSECLLYGVISPTSSRCKVDTLLYRSYVLNDLRQPLFFTLTAGDAYFKGQYTGNFNPFAGIATNELYLIKAEANARLNNTSAAMADLNTLLLKRWKTGSFTPMTATDPSDALKKILLERRKELPFTGMLRWSDLRRLNKEAAFSKTLIRNLNGQLYTLPPNDPRYVYPIPDNEIQLNNIQQNPR